MNVGPVHMNGASSFALCLCVYGGFEDGTEDGCDDGREDGGPRPNYDPRSTLSLATTTLLWLFLPFAIR